MTVISEIFCRSVFFFLLFLLFTLNQTTEESARPNNHPRLLRVSFSPTTSKDAATQYILHYANEVLIIKSARPNRSIATTLGGASSTALFSFHFSLALAYFLFPFKFWFSFCFFRLLHSYFRFYFIFFLVFSLYLSFFSYLSLFILPIFRLSLSSPLPLPLSLDFISIIFLFLLHCLYLLPKLKYTPPFSSFILAFSN